MTDRLALYNSALRDLGQRKLSSLSENVEARRVLDDVYDQTLKYCLEKGAWNFAIRTVLINPDVSVNVDFGFRYAFTKPVDWLRTVGLAADEYIRDPLLEYVDERGYWWADANPLYVRYVSNDPAYGLDLTAWPESFTRYVELSLAHRIALGVTGSESTRERLAGEMKKAGTDAKSRDAMNDPPAFAPVGSWARARTGGAHSRRNRGA
jgi:hypothetical protein